MTKDLEVAALDAFIAKLGPHTYLGPWLADQRDAIVRDIATDILPSPMLPSTAHRVAAQIVADAKEAATVITDLARDKADVLRRETEKACGERRGYVAAIIERAASEAVGVLSGRRA
jgi:hypothetical protein